MEGSLLNPFVFLADSAGGRPLTMTPVDWLVLIVPILVVSVVALKTRRYVRSVADFMSASRVAGSSPDFAARA